MDQGLFPRSTIKKDKRYLNTLKWQIRKLIVFFEIIVVIANIKSSTKLILKPSKKLKNTYTYTNNKKEKANGKIISLNQNQNQQQRQDIHFSK